jgi:hypothetical protein
VSAFVAVVLEVWIVVVGRMKVSVAVVVVAVVA